MTRYKKSSKCVLMDLLEASRAHISPPPKHITTLDTLVSRMHRMRRKPHIWGATTDVATEHEWVPVTLNKHTQHKTQT